MLYRFISLFLVSLSTLSLSAVATDTCSAVSKDCDALGPAVDVVGACMNTYAKSQSPSDAQACHERAQDLILVLKDSVKDAQNCDPAASDASDICGKLIAVAPKITATLDVITRVSSVFKANGRGEALCSDMRSTESSYRSAAAEFYVKFSEFSQCSNAFTTALDVAAKLQSTTQACCA